MHHSNPHERDWMAGHKVAGLAPHPHAADLAPIVKGRVSPAPYVAGGPPSGPHWVALVNRMVETVTTLQPPGLWEDPRFRDFVEVKVGRPAWI